MDLNQSKLKSQLEAIDLWVKAKGVGRFVQPTGFGKTYEMMLIINKFHKKYPTRPILWIGDNTAAKSNFQRALAELKSTFDDIVRTNLHVHTKNELLMGVTDYLSYYSLVIVDEVHKFTKDGYFLLNKSIFDYKFIAGFTGTDPVGKDKKLLDSIMPIVAYMSKEEAIDAEWISDFREYNLGLVLSPEDRKLYDEYSDYIKYSLNVADNNYDLLTAMGSGKFSKVRQKFKPAMEFCIEHAASKGWTKDLDISHRYYKQIDDVFSPSNLYQRATKFRYYVAMRNKMLDEHPLKLNTTLKLVNLTKPKYTIIFNNSTGFIDVIHSIINSNTPVDTNATFKQLQSRYKQKTYIYDEEAVKVHSSLPTLPVLTKDGFMKWKNGKIRMFGTGGQNKLALERVNNGEVKIICAVKSLDSAWNIEELEVEIITGGSTDPIQQEQRIGRSLRITELKKLALIINVYFKDTRDEQKLLARQRNSTNTIYDINEPQDILK